MESLTYAWCWPILLSQHLQRHSKWGHPRADCGGVFFVRFGDFPDVLRCAPRILSSSPSLYGCDVFAMTPKKKQRQLLTIFHPPPKKLTCANLFHKKNIKNTTSPILTGLHMFSQAICCIQFCVLKPRHLYASAQAWKKWRCFQWTHLIKPCGRCSSLRGLCEYFRSTPYPGYQSHSSGFPILKMVHNPGDDWNPGWGTVPTNTHISIISYSV